MSSTVLRHFALTHSVAKGKKLRLVIDLRHVNNFLVRFKFKYEDLRSLSHVLEEGHWFLHVISGKGATMWISVWSTRPISDFLDGSMAGRDILLLQFCLLALVALVLFHQIVATLSQAFEIDES